MYLKRLLIIYNKLSNKYRDEVIFDKNYWLTKIRDNNKAYVVAKQAGQQIKIINKIIEQLNQKIKEKKCSDLTGKSISLTELLNEHGDESKHYYEI